MNGVTGHDIQNTMVFLVRVSKRSQPGWCIIKQIFCLQFMSEICDDMAYETLTVIVVPVLPAQGFGSADWPGLAGAREPST